MKISRLLFPLICSAGLARADVNYSIAKGQARRDANQNNAQQGVTPAAPQSPAAPAQPPVDPALAATQQNIARLRADFAAIGAAANPAAADDQRIALLNDLVAAAQGKKASAANVKNLAAQLIQTLAGRAKLSAAHPKLARDVHALFNGARLTDTQQAALLDEVKKFLLPAEVSEEGTAKVVDALAAIATDTK